MILSIVLCMFNLFLRVVPLLFVCKILLIIFYRLKLLLVVVSVCSLGRLSVLRVKVLILQIKVVNKSYIDVAGNHSVRGSDPHLQLIVVRGYRQTKPNLSPSILPNLINSTLELIRLVPIHAILIWADWVVTNG